METCRDANSIPIEKIVNVLTIEREFCVVVARKISALDSTLHLTWDSVWDSKGDILI